MSDQEEREEQAELVKASHEGDLAIGDEIISCAVLEDGQRVLTQEGFLLAIGRAAKAKAGQGAEEGNVAFLAARNLQRHVSLELRDAVTPVRFRSSTGSIAFGFKAQVLPMVCEAYLSAREAGDLVKSQYHVAQQCEIIVRGLAQVGIVALVDEATGYQKVRTQRALEKILEKYLSQERSKWAKRFPDEFYRQIFRLKRWSFSPEGFHKRPSVVGHYTNDIVYDRLAPYLLEELRDLNPTMESGSREAKHHQHLTSDIGLPALQEHIVGVVALMKACSTWSQFQRMLSRVYPKANDQIEMFVEGIEIEEGLR